MWGKNNIECVPLNNRGQPGRRQRKGAGGGLAMEEKDSQIIRTFPF